MNLPAVFLTGLLAGGVSCAAVQGGLLTGLVARQSTADSAPRLGSDLAPVGGFLAGKLFSHALLGALLGLAGSAMTLSVHLRAMLQIGAGILIVVLGLAQLGVRGFKNLIIEPPASWTRLVRTRARSTSALAPTILGVATVLIPCGVTLSVMALAIATGSPWQGAAVMTAFVAGTAPLFALLGYVAQRARRTAGPWQRRLAVATGLVVLTLGVYTFNGGLELSGSPLAASSLTATLGLSGEPERAPGVDDSAGPVTVADGRQTVVITALTDQYTPDTLQITAGLPTTLVVRSKRATGCVRSFVIPSMNKDWILPVDGDTTIDLGTPTVGTVRYSCGMGMYTGKLIVKAAS